MPVKTLILICLVALISGCGCGCPEGGHKCPGDRNWSICA